jgi:sporulation protein YlmC with PRC-barrel domain
MSKKKQLPVKPYRGRLLDARLHLLDRQMDNSEGHPVGTVDDLELDGISVGEPIARGAPAPKVRSILSGHVLTTRILGGRPPRSRLQEIPWRFVERVGVVIEVDDAATSDAQWFEHWLRDYVIEHIPGGRRAAQ